MKKICHHLGETICKSNSITEDIRGLTNHMKLHPTYQPLRKCKFRTTVRYYYTSTRMAIIIKTDNVMCYRGRKTSSFLLCWWGCKMVQQFLKKLNINLPHDPPVLLLGITIREMKMCPQKASHMNVTEALFIMFPGWKQSKCPSTVEWINKI